MKTVKLEIKTNEYWYGGSVNDGYLFPLSVKDEYYLDLTDNNTYNQLNPLFLSSMGRYIWLEDGGKIWFSNGVISIVAEEIEIDETENCLKNCYLAAMRKHFPPNRRLPKEFLFTKPQLCTWVALKQAQTQSAIIDYAKSYLAAGYEPGVIVIDDGWQIASGNWNFDANKIPNPKKMIDTLHGLGFYVSLWLVPYVMKDSPDVAMLKESGAFIRNTAGEFIDAVWFDGISYALDLTTDSARNWLENVAARLTRDYGVDGFKLDCGDAMFLKGAYGKKNIQNTLWAQVLTEKNDYNIELRSCFKYGGKNCIQRLADKAHIFSVEFVKDENYAEGGFIRYGLSSVLPAMLAQGILGYWYGCPDMVGGGLVTNDFPDVVNDELLIRFCQDCALMPTVQFSYPYWLSKNAAVRDSMKQAMALREKFLDYILRLIKNASEMGEPVVRYMEYEFPHIGLEKVVSQYMLGEEFMIVPIAKQGAEKQTVYFPENTLWRNIITGKEYKAGICEIDVDINSLLVYQRINNL